MTIYKLTVWCDMDWCFEDLAYFTDKEKIDAWFQTQDGIEALEKFDREDFRIVEIEVL